MNQNFIQSNVTDVKEKFVGLCVKDELCVTGVSTEAESRIKFQMFLGNKTEKAHVWYVGQDGINTKIWVRMSTMETQEPTAINTTTKEKTMATETTAEAAFT